MEAGSNLSLKFLERIYLERYTNSMFIIFPSLSTLFELVTM